MLLVTLQRLALSPARLILVYASFVTVIGALSWVEWGRVELQKRIHAASSFEGYPMHVLKTSLEDANYYEIGSPQLNVDALSTLLEHGNAAIWVFGQMVEVGVGPDLHPARRRIAVAFNSRSFPASRDGACIVLGATVDSHLGEHLWLSAGEACQVVSLPTTWRVADFASDVPTLVVTPDLAERMLGPRWQWFISTAFVSGPSRSGTGIRQTFEDKGAIVSIASPPEDGVLSETDVRNRQMLSKVAPIVRWAGVTGCAFFLVLLFGGQSRSLRREVGLLQVLGASPWQVGRLLVADALLQAWIVIAPISMLAMLQVAFDARLVSIVIDLARLSVVLTLVALCWSAVLMLRVRGVDPGVLVKGETG
jgi:hypothetical protein